MNIVFWSGSLPIIMNPQNNLAVQGPSIVNGNLFVLSWLSFFMSWVVLKHVLEQLYVMDQARGGNLAYLTPCREGYPPLIPMTRSRLANLGLILSSLVVLTSSARSYKQQVCSESSQQLCQRLKFIVSASVLSFVGLLVAWTVYFLWKRNNSVDVNRPSSPAFRLFLTGLLTMGWFVATSVGTFGRHAPAHSVGNLFLGVWISFLLSMFLCKKTLVEYLSARACNQQRRSSLPKSNNKNTSPSNNKKKNKIPGLVQDEDNDEEEPEEVEAPISTKATDDFDTPMLVTPKASDKHVSPSQTHSTIAMSLEESFENQDRGSMRILRQVSTEQTVEAGESFEDEVQDDASAKTARRGSARRMAAAANGTSTPNTSNRSSPNHLVHNSVSSSQPSRGDTVVQEQQRQQRPPRPTSIPYATSDYDRHGLSTSAVTTAMDNTTTTGTTNHDHDDVLIDPEDF